MPLYWLGHLQIEHDHGEQDHEEEDHDDDDDQFPHQPIAPAYNRLIAISAKKGKKFSESLQFDPHKVTRLSLSEQAFEKAVVSHGPEIIRYLQ